MDHLGFMDSVIIMAVIVTIFTLLPFCGSLYCGVNSRRRIQLDGDESFLLRIVFVALYAVMYYLVNEEFVQCHEN